MQESISQRMAYLLDHDEPFAYCVITATMGSTPRRAGAAMIVTLDGTVTGSVGGGEVEKRLITAAQDALRERQARLLTFDPSAPGLTSCGGSMDVFIQVFSPPSRLCIFGAGHIGRALADLAAGLGFQVMLLDMDPDAGKKEPLRPGITRVSGSREELLVQCVPSPDTYFVIATKIGRAHV